MAGAGLGMMCVVLVLAVPLGLAIGSVILMGAVWIANKRLGQPGQRSSRYDDDEYDDDWDSFSRPQRGSSDTAIPKPNFGQALLIVFVNGIVSFVIGFALGFVATSGGMARNQTGIFAIQVAILVINFLASAGVLTAMLPTTFLRACFVVWFEFLICVALILVIGAPLVVLGVGLGGLQ